MVDEKNDEWFLTENEGGGVLPLLPFLEQNFAPERGRDKICQNMKKIRKNYEGKANTIHPYLSKFNLLWPGWAGGKFNDEICSYFFPLFRLT